MKWGHEYMALSMATKQVVLMQQLFTDLGLKSLLNGDTIVYADNRSANDWANDEKISQGNQWILADYHYVREMGPSGEGLINVKFIPTKLNLADVFTKGVPLETLTRLVGPLLGHIPLSKALEGIEDAGGETRTLPPAPPVEKNQDSGRYPVPPAGAPPDGAAPTSK